MRQALYRKYRSRSFDEVVGQDHITHTLKMAIKSGRISHAYLFTGPRGVGKTSVARILAHAVNDFDYTGESNRLDIIEIDAASNRRIDEVRDLREKVAITPVEGKYKVYIIDEVHMLTREAFNALLKTLEEPPAHTIFILATTEAHKLPETIISRTQRYEFKPIAPAQAVKHLKSLAKQEKISVSPAALELLAEFSGGSFRDSIGYLDQLSSGGDISEDAVRQILGIPSGRQVSQLLEAIKAGRPKEIMDTVQRLKEQGVDAAAAARSIAQGLRTSLITDGSDPNVLRLLKDLVEVPAAAQPYDYLEVSLLEAAAPKMSPASPAAAPKALNKIAQAVVEPPARSNSSTTRPLEFDISVWPQVIDSTRRRAASLYTALRIAEPTFDGSSLILKLEYPLHQKKLNLSKNKDIIAGIIEELTGQRIRIECQVDKTAFRNSKKPLQAERENLAPLHSINNVFGATEVLEA